MSSPPVHLPHGGGELHVAPWHEARYDIVAPVMLPVELDNEVQNGTAGDNGMATRASLTTSQYYLFFSGRMNLPVGWAAFRPLMCTLQG